MTYEKFKGMNIGEIEYSRYHIHEGVQLYNICDKQYVNTCSRHKLNKHILSVYMYRNMYNILK